MHVSLMIFVKKACLLHGTAAVFQFPACNWSKFHSAWPIMMKGQPFLWIPSSVCSCCCLKSVCLFGQKWNASEGKQYLYCISFRLIFKLPWFPLCLLHYINLCEVFFIIKQSGLSRSFVLLPVAGICFGLKGRFQYCNLVRLLMWCYIGDTLYQLPWFL